MQFDPIERATILAEWDRHATAGAIRNRGSFGRPVILAAILIGVVLGIIAVVRKQAIPGDLVIAVLAAVGMLALAGLLAWIFGAAYAAAQAYRRVEEAVAWLSKHCATLAAVEEKRAAAVTVISHAYYRGGPWTICVYDRRDVARRLGAALVYVQAIEEILCRERGLARMFTRAATSAATDLS